MGLVQRGAASTARRLWERPCSPQRCCGFFSCQRFLRGEESSVKKSPTGLKVGKRVEPGLLHPQGLTLLLESADGGVEGGGTAADRVAGSAGARQGAVGGVGGEQQEAAIVGVERRGAGLRAGPAAGHIVLLCCCAVEGDHAAVIGQHPVEDVDAGIGHRLWMERRDKG